MTTLLKSFVPNIDFQKTYAMLGMGNEYAGFVKLISAKERLNLWFMPVVKGVTCDKVVAALRKLRVHVRTYVNSLDRNLPANDRDPNRDGSYVVSFRRVVEVDQENENLSANVLIARGRMGITLLERLLLELGYFLATHKYMNVKSMTLCVASRYSINRIPCVGKNLRGPGIVVTHRSLACSAEYLCSRSLINFFRPNV